MAGTITRSSQDFRAGFIESAMLNGSASLAKKAKDAKKVAAFQDSFAYFAFFAGPR